VNVLIISPHPDDEAIGCGGTLRKHVEDGDVVSVAFLTSGEAGGHDRPPDETASVREAEARLAADILGYHHLWFWRYPDGGLDGCDALGPRMLEILQSDTWDRVYVPHERESHRDHQGAARAVLAAVRCLEDTARPLVLGYEVWTPLQELDVIVDVTPHMEVKLAAVRAHASQCTAVQFDEAVRALNRYRGELHSWPGGPYAEVFKVLRP
jgi:LmbE family N-acetylglucosaminyl deacetylase